MNCIICNVKGLHHKECIEKKHKELFDILPELDTVKTVKFGRREVISEEDGNYEKVVDYLKLFKETAKKVMKLDVDFNYNFNYSEDWSQWNIDNLFNEPVEGTTLCTDDIYADLFAETRKQLCMKMGVTEYEYFHILSVFAGREGSVIEANHDS